MLALASPLGAQAGLVTGNWDPAFGSFLPGLWYQVKAEWDVPDACRLQDDGIYTTAGGACAGSTVLSAKLRLFDIGLANPGTFDENSPNSFNFEMNPPFSPPNPGAFGVTRVRVLGQQIVGVDAGQFINLPTLTSPTSANFNGVVVAALNNSFGLHFGVLGPVVTCFNCSDEGDGPVPGNLPVLASTAGLTQVLTTFNGDGSPALRDTNGNTLGVLLDEKGVFVRQIVTATPVPEPGSLALVLAALGSAAWLRRRRT
ncbi:MAG: PEP-CTERM sorting domain-containing protein [Aquabacterium sp.]|nr:PEP-CTERM sorting domain-containing protein [Aquabacterium sp.]